jgi:hypothetical protein
LMNRAGDADWRSLRFFFLDFRAETPKEEKSKHQKNTGKKKKKSEASFCCGLRLVVGHWWSCASSLFGQ